MAPLPMARVDNFFERPAARRRGLLSCAVALICDNTKRIDCVRVKSDAAADRSASGALRLVCR